MRGSQRRVRAGRVRTAERESYSQFSRLKVVRLKPFGGVLLDSRHTSKGCPTVCVLVVSVSIQARLRFSSPGSAARFHYCTGRLRLRQNLPRYASTPPIASATFGSNGPVPKASENRERVWPLRRGSAPLMVSLLSDVLGGPAVLSARYRAGRTGNSALTPTPGRNETRLLNSIPANRSVPTGSLRFGHWFPTSRAAARAPDPGAEHPQCWNRSRDISSRRLRGHASARRPHRPTAAPPAFQAGFCRPTAW